MAFIELLNNVLPVRIEQKVNDLRRNPAGHFGGEFQQNLSEMKPIFYLRALTAKGKIFTLIGCYKNFMLLFHTSTNSSGNSGQSSQSRFGGSCLGHME